MLKECHEPHVWMPPMRSERVGFLIRRASSPPCAVATSWTPRCAMLLAASASASVPISSCTGVAVDNRVCHVRDRKVMATREGTAKPD